MSSPSFDATIDIAPRPSLRALQALFWLHVLPLGLMLIALEPGWRMAVLAGALGASWLWLRRHPAFGYGHKALTRLTWHQDDSWTLHPADGSTLEGRLSGNSLLNARLIVLNFELKQGGRRTRVLLGDELEPELLWRLYARLSQSVPAK
jgi:toxin CptA